MGHFRYELGIRWFPIITPYPKSEAGKHVPRNKVFLIFKQLERDGEEMKFGGMLYPFTLFCEGSGLQKKLTDQSTLV